MRKSKIFHEKDLLKIEIPNTKNWFLTLFTFCWMVGWFIGAFFAVIMFAYVISAKLTIGIIFLASWLIVWAIGGVVVLKHLVWGLFGKEVIIVDGNYIHISTRGLLFNKPKKYLISEIKNWRIFDDRNTFDKWNIKNFGFQDIDKFGTIKFDYHLKTINFAKNVDESEANYLVDLINDKVKMYVEHD